jgi:hypothetical protein
LQFILQGIFYADYQSSTIRAIISRAVTPLLALLVWHKRGVGLIGAEYILTSPNLQTESGSLLQCRTALEKVGVNGIHIGN